MIDFGLTKMIVVGAVALIVIGPERLPTVARMIGSLVGRAQRYLNQVKAELSREMFFEEVHTAQKAVRNNIHDMIDDIQGTKETLSQEKISMPSIWDGRTHSSFHIADNTKITKKAQQFRKTKKRYINRIPDWYKRQTIHRTRVISASARVAKYRIHTQTR